MPKLVFFLVVWLLVAFRPGIHSEDRSIVTDIQSALNLGDNTLNYTREECVWRPSNNVDACPDPDIKFYFYSGRNMTGGELHMSETDFLRTHNWDPMKKNVILIHGYAGGNGIFPAVILRDAYVRNGSYNVFVVDWGQLARTPCYVAAVHNVKIVAQCTAHLFNFIRNTGVSSKSITCIGHSLGAHVCGLIGSHLLFRVHRIIALDPAKPLIRNPIRLKSGVADAVQVIHTNAGNYGEAGKVGKIDFCLNGGKMQPLCANKTRADLCSHVLGICYLADSIDISNSLKATPCSRRCPSGPRPTHRIGLPVLLGEHTPESATGSYCVNTKKAPYCPRDGKSGHPWCCLDGTSTEYYKMTSAIIENLLSDALHVSILNHDRQTWSLGPCVLDVADPCISGKVLFYLYTRKLWDTPVTLSVDAASLPKEYDRTADIKVLIHGYAGSIDFKGIVAVRRAYQLSGNYNVIVVDWGELVRLPCYPVAVLNTLQAGKCTASMLANLASLSSRDIREFHAIGFSLGAHVASFASNELLTLKKGRLGRITGLDPALPLFASLEKDWKLDKGDAEFVDVIHTNAGVFGKIETMGHVDFYINDGFSQPACKNSTNIPLCSHIMALSYYAESIIASDNESFWGIPCMSFLQHFMGMCKANSYGIAPVLMGDKCDRNARGIYAVTTRERPPYALGKPPWIRKHRDFH